MGIITDDAAVIRLIGAVRMEQHGERQVAERGYFSEDSIKLVTTPDQEVTPALPAA